MTNKEAVDLLDNLIGMVEDNQDSDYDTALKMGINALTAQQWIPCSERLPEKEDIYLVAFDKDSLLESDVAVSDAYWKDGKWQYAMIEVYEHKMPKFVIEPIEELKIAKWMPLPES